MATTVDLPERARAILTDDKPPDEFGWVDWLTPRHMRLFAIELNAALAAPTPEKLRALLESWEATAELDHSPELQGRLERHRRRTAVQVDEWLAKKDTA